MTQQTLQVEHPYQLSEKVQAIIEKALTKYPANQRASAVKTALMAVQDEAQGFLTRPMMDAVARYLGMPNIAVYEVASFYTLFDLEPVGRHKIYLCTNVSCMLCGSDTLYEHLQKKLQIRFGETTSDGQFTLKEAECLAACGGAPAMQIGTRYYENLTPERVDRILDALQEEAACSTKSV